MAAVAAVGAVGSVGSAPSKNNDFKLDLKDSAGAAGVDAQAASPAKAEKYDIGSNDINTNSGESIFQVISDRYIKSGYPKLLDEIPLPPTKK